MTRHVDARPAILALTVSIGSRQVAHANESDMFSLNFHFAPPEYAGCAEVLYDDENVSCAFLDTDYDESNTLNWAWVFVGAVSGPAGPGINTLIFRHRIRSQRGGAFLGVVHGRKRDRPGRFRWDMARKWDRQRPELGERVLPRHRERRRRHQGRVRRLRARICGSHSLRVGEAQGSGCDAIPFQICDALLGTGDFEPDGTGDTNTCGWSCPVPVREMTWAEIKDAYR